MHQLVAAQQDLPSGHICGNYDTTAVIAERMTNPTDRCSHLRLEQYRPIIAHSLTSLCYVHARAARVIAGIVDSIHSAVVAGQPLPWRLRGGALWIAVSQDVPGRHV